jgi:hypothetical protein
MNDPLRGTIHFHSTYSHDGKSTLTEIAMTLKDRGFSFCVMTEHFEDLDAARFDQYVKEAAAVTQASGFLLIPAVELDLSGLHTILFPVRTHEEVVRLASDGSESEPRLFKLLAHPTKYRLDKVLQHLEKHNIDGVELWNQEADGRFLPPFGLLDSLRKHPKRNQYKYFFGCDIHNVKLAVSNVIVIPEPGSRTSQGVIAALASGNFLSRNLETGIEYRNSPTGGNFEAWVEALHGKSYYRGRLLRTCRRSLRSAYKMLPRNLQRSLNDVKNSIRHRL